MTGDPVFTHRATMTISSNEAGEDVHVKVVWAPDIDGAAIEALGYMPAAYRFVQQYLVPALEEAYNSSGYPEWDITPPESIN